MRTAPLLWLLSILFLLRVMGQVLVEFWQVRFLPSTEEWFSGLLPYPHLLASQIVILLAMGKINWDFTTESGWSYRSRRHVGVWLLALGVVYLLVMIIRYVVRMSLYPHERWTGGSIPIFFHWVLATYVLVLGRHHWRHRILPRNKKPPGAIQTWGWRLAYLTAWGMVALGMLLWTISMLLPTLLASHLGFRGPEYAVRIERRVKLTTSDGVDLVADIYHPQRAGPKVATILVRIPYSKTLTNKMFATLVGQMWAERGYTVVIQGTRGRYESGGEYDPLRHERDDGIATLAWLAQQPWYDGRLGMWGGSYFGYTQWVLADCQDPGPSGLLIQEASTDFHGMFHPGGAYSLQSALHWAVMAHGRQDVTPQPEALAHGFAGFPLIEADNRAAADIPFFNDWVLHTDRDDYWAQIDGDNRARHVKVPVLLMAGWYDPFLPTQIRDFMTIRREADPGVATETRLIIGPWAHAEAVKLPDGTMPRNYRLESLAPSIPWFDRQLLGRKGPGTAPVRIYVMGINEWRDEQEWPLARTKYARYYLHSQGMANAVSGDGKLTVVQPAGDEPPDRFVYDPRDPVPTVGGAMLGSGAGIARQNAVEARDDVLVYTTEPLAEDLEVTGPIGLVLHVSTSAPNTDFTGKLVDVFADGSAFNLSEGIFRRSYELGGRAPTRIEIELWPTSNVFRKGHRIRLEISSSNYPRFDRNPNTARTIATETSPVAANQVVHHDVDFPSHLLLPVIPHTQSD